MKQLEAETVLIRSENVLSTDLEDEVVMMDIEEGSYFSLQGPTARVWELLEEKTTVKTLRDTLLDEYSVSTEQCDKELLELLQQMDDRGLVIVSPQ